ncbi:hypothetical protein NEOLI_001311 [Neolecta irregularis DAH-3]|uniref:Uncharacterized protein n=1 Tax=Neolecta irregularis (strain DAH-3) TaxID=1198029 RepID=A0A1U7LKL7_NEOID|nr:hypothetical protein NEOLI_001311 [Neolecta irregularis DAH-3]|eukprot:OLL23200.1 hypothetical protein NEOLI_001311 [Neolecta irregularis DAH-3]
MVPAYFILTVAFLPCFSLAAYDRSAPTYLLVSSGIDGLASPNVVFSNDEMYIGTPPDDSETLYVHLDNAKLSFVKYTESIMGVQYAYIETAGRVKFTPARSETQGDIGFAGYDGFLIYEKHSSWCARKIKSNGLYRVEWKKAWFNPSCVDIQLRLVEVRGRGKFRNQNSRK